MSPQIKRRLWFIGAAVLLLVGVWRVLTPSTPETRIKWLFSELSLGIPEYETLHKFDQPIDAIKGDFFSLEISQSDVQFQRFIAKIGTSSERILSADGSTVRTGSRNNLWWLHINARITNAPGVKYRIQIEGRQTYD